MSMAESRIGQTQISQTQIGQIHTKGRDFSTILKYDRKITCHLR